MCCSSFTWKRAGSPSPELPGTRLVSGWSRSPAARRKETWGYLNPRRYVLHDRDKKFCAAFRSVLTAAGVKPIMLPAKSPNLNAYAERWVRSVKQECLSKLVLLGEGPLQPA